MGYEACSILNTFLSDNTCCKKKVQGKKSHSFRHDCLDILLYPFSNDLKYLTDCIQHGLI